jgi:hypothetical protein
MAAHAVVLCIQDATELNFNGQQASKPASQQASKPASQQASKPASQQASKPADWGR